MTARELDSNGWMEIKDNPISKVGVFPYRGAMCDPNGDLGLDPEGIYNVYRSAFELSKPETIESFKLIPWIEEHEILGNDGIQQTPTDERPIDGVIGEDVYFRDGTLYGNLKLFSGGLESKIDSGKRELSCGYRCKYELKEGMYGDQKFSVVQTGIMGNHVALVDSGRMGPEVSVLDHLEIFTIDSKDFKDMPYDNDKDKKAAMDEEEDKRNMGQDADYDDEKKGMDEEEEKRNLGQDIGPLAAAAGGALAASVLDDDDDTKAEDEDDDESKAEDGDDDEKKDSNAMDALDTRVRKLTRGLASLRKNGVKSFMREIGKRDALYAKASPFIGAFDHNEMTLDEMAVYACDQLKLDVPKGHEVTALDSYFHNRTPAPVFAPVGGASFGMDSKTDSSSIDAYFAGSK